MEEVAALLPPGSNAFEFGSGRSTISLRRMSAGTASIEDSADWLSRTEQLEDAIPKRASDFSEVVPLTRCWNRLRPIESFNVAAQRESLLRLQQAKLILVDSPPNPAKREHALQHGRRKVAAVPEKKAKPAKPASINRSLQLLGQAYKLAIANGRLCTAQHIRKLREVGNARQGFFSRMEFRSVLRNLPAYLLDWLDFALLAQLTAWRPKEIRSLSWFSLDGATIRLRTENAKTRVARNVPLVGELVELMGRQRLQMSPKTSPHFSSEDAPIFARAKNGLQVGGSARKVVLQPAPFRGAGHDPKWHTSVRGHEHQRASHGQHICPLSHPGRQGSATGSTEPSELQRRSSQPAFDNGRACQHHNGNSSDENSHRMRMGSLKLARFFFA